MSDYQLYCVAESGNAYKAALMLELCGLDWEPVAVDFFNGETRGDDYRQNVNEMGEIPVLVHGVEKISQSGVILHYLADATGRLGGQTDRERRDVMRWVLFDNHKLTSYVATLRFMVTFLKSDDEAVLSFLLGRAKTAMQLVDNHLAEKSFVTGERPTIADLSMCGYLYYDGELGFELADYPNVMNWLDRIKALDGWKHPYDLMPRGLSQT